MSIADTRDDLRPVEPAETLRERLRWLASDRGDDAFLVLPSQGGRPDAITYGEMEALARRVGGLLSSYGVGRGDAVHLHLGNRWQYVAVLLGCAEVGAVAVPTNPSATVDDVAFITSQARCVLSITEAGLVPIVHAACEMAPEIAHVLAVGGPADGATDFDEAVAATEPVAGRAPLVGSDLAMVLYTSGTTGWPKGVMLTHANLTFAGEAVSAHLRMRNDDRWLVALPLFHMNALGYSLMSTFCTGASAAIVDGFRPEAFGRQARETGATLASLFAVHIRQLLATPAHEGDDQNALRMAMFAQQVTSEERTAFEARFGTPLLHIYGLTETLAPTLSEPVNGQRVNGTLGRPTLWSTIRIVDRAGRPVEPGERGELEVRGEVGVTLAAGYLGHPELLDECLHDGWFRTGDQMRLDADGRYLFLGRSLDLVKPAVDNVSTTEIERVLLEHVSVLDVAVVGVPDAEGNEAICAFVVLRPGEDDTTEAELLSWARERLAEYKVPSRLVLVDDLPRSPVGKVLKGELKGWRFLPG